MPVNPAVLIRKLVSLPHAMVRAIDDYRFQHRIKTESGTIRHLIERGLKRSGAVLSQAGEENGRPPSPGPYPWERAGLEDTVRAMNMDVPARLKLQLDWLVNQGGAAGKPVTLKGLVIPVLQDHANRELRARGIDPD